MSKIKNSDITKWLDTEFEDITRPPIFYLKNNELINLKNTILTPHSLCWTDECFDSIATEAITSILNFFNNKKITNRVV